MGAGVEPLLVASHGPSLWRALAEEVVENTIAPEAVAASAYRSLALAGELGPIPAALLRKHFSCKHEAYAYYGPPA